MSGWLVLWLVFVSVIAFGLFRSLTLGSRIAAALSLPRWDRNLSRRVVLKGVVNPPEEARSLIARYRLETLLLYAFAFGAMFLTIGLPVVAFLLVAAIIAVLSEPLDLNEFTSGGGR